MSSQPNQTSSTSPPLTSQQNASGSPAIPNNNTAPTANGKPLTSSDSADSLRNSSTTAAPASKTAAPSQQSQGNTHKKTKSTDQDLAKDLGRMRLASQTSVPDDKQKTAEKKDDSKDKPAKDKGQDKGDKDKDKKKKSGDQTIRYSAERVIGNGSFGIVYQATVNTTGETVAIKKVLQDKRFKNRELMIMKILNHPNVMMLKHCFYSHDKPDELYLNIVMEFVPQTIYRASRDHTKMKKSIHPTLVKVYTWQLCRALSYCHSLGICHRDIKPQNLLLDPNTHIVKLCDFGSAKVLNKGEPNVSYICSRYYRAPELIFCASDYTTSIDVWSLGCVLAELLIGHPLFPGESGIDQLVEIIKILGTPTRDDINAMNQNYIPQHPEFAFPNIQPHPWSKVFRNKAPEAAVDLVSRFLVYRPNERMSPFEALTHPFFDELRDPNARLPNGKPFPSLFNFVTKELIMLDAFNLVEKIFPQTMWADARKQMAAAKAQEPNTVIPIQLYPLPMRREKEPALFQIPSSAPAPAGAAAPAGSAAPASAPSAQPSSSAPAPAAAPAAQPVKAEAK